jgi:ceramide glucosyltransferase
MEEFAEILYQVFFWLLLSGVSASTFYYLFCLYSAAIFFHKEESSHPSTAYTPPLSILKPVRGVDARAYECFASFCRQDYPDYEIIFGVKDADDPAIKLIEKLRNEFPEHQIKLVINPHMIGTSGKVSNLHNMLPEAANEILIISDSDISVRPDYLRSVMAPLADQNIGMVTCPYRAVGGTNFSALMETIGITGEFMPGVLVARQLEGIKFAFGSTIATRKEVISSFGGFRAIADYLGDDYLLGNLTAKAGYKVCLSTYVVETVLPDYRFSNFIRHQLRWALNTRFSRPAGYVGLIFTHSIPLALLMILLFHSSMIACISALCSITVRFAAAWFVGVIGLKDRRLRRYFYLLPVRDLISFAVWLISFSGNTVEWHGDRFRLETGGRLVPIDIKNR